MLHFTDERGASIELEPDAFTIAGYTGRDRAMVQKHIDELEREGIAPPPEVPMWYVMPPEILTTAATIEVTSPQSCGEVEPVHPDSFVPRNRGILATATLDARQSSAAANDR